MSLTLRRYVQAGFTLVELLIVVIILAILAAIVIPQFASSTTDAQESALDANLAAMRSAIELYKVQHNGVYPGAVTAVSAACTGGTTGTGTAADATNRAQAWMDQLLLASDVDGKTCSLSTIGGVLTFRFGPYLRKGIPVDPIKGKGAVVGEIAVTNTGAALAPSADTGGWAYDTISGQIVMNSNAPDSKTKLYSTH